MYVGVGAVLTSLSGPLSDVPTGFCMSVGGIFYPLVTWDLLDPIDSESRAFETEFDVIEQCPQLFLIHCSRQVYNEQTLLCSPFFNALKYCTIFPVHALSIMMQYSSPNQVDRFTHEVETRVVDPHEVSLQAALSEARDHSLTWQSRSSGRSQVRKTCLSSRVASTRPSTLRARALSSAR
eukprot:scaffold7979_cov417-Prasinococcus_capsulatus_cf.AAC.2